MGYGEAVRSTGSAALFKGGDILKLRVRLWMRVWAIRNRQIVLKDSDFVQAEDAITFVRGVMWSLIKTSGLVVVAKSGHAPDHLGTIAPRARDFTATERKHRKE